MCSARVDPVLVTEAFLQGLDGVLVLGCHLGDCHYTSGNYYSRSRMRMVQKLFQIVGLESERLYLDWVSASEGKRFAEIVAEFTQRIRSLGPLRHEGQKHNQELEEKLLTVEDVVKKEKVRWLVGSEVRLVETGNVYGEEVSQEKIELLMEEILQREYVRSRILLLLRDGELSAREIAQELKIGSQEVFQHITTMLPEGKVQLLGVSGRSPRYRVGKK